MTTNKLWIHALREWANRGLNSKSCNKLLKEALEELDELEEEAREQKTEHGVRHGKWLISKDFRLTEDGFQEVAKLYCSVCDKVPINKAVMDGHIIWEIPDIKGMMRYCPNCGAKMGGGDANV